MAKYSVLVFIVVMKLVSSVNGQEQTRTEDDMCAAMVETLCVKDMLSDIAKAAKKIHKMANEIEDKIRQKDPNNDSLGKHINYKIIIINSTFPLSKTHNQFSEINNIDKNDLVHLIKEEYYSVSYLYNSINNLRRTKSIFGNEIDGEFNTIQTILQEKMICNYRRILSAYGEKWLSIHQINGIHFERTGKRELTSFVYNTNAIILVRLLRQWMESINNIASNIESKVF